jgi:hypothetical protein
MPHFLFMFSEASRFFREESKADKIFCVFVDGSEVQLTFLRRTLLRKQIVLFYIQGASVNRKTISEKQYEKVLE